MQNESLNIQKINQNNKKNKGARIVLRVFKIILFIVLLPFIILYYFFHLIHKSIKKANWEKEGKRGKLLLMQSNISDIDLMEGYEFENYLQTLLFYAGFVTEVTPASKDYGADLILTEPDTKNKIVVQAKRYNKTVGVKSVQEVIGAKSHYKAEEGVVITNSHFSYEAETLAKENQIRLIDREELIQMYKDVQQKLSISAHETKLVGQSKNDLETIFPFMI